MSKYFLEAYVYLIVQTNNVVLNGLIDSNKELNMNNMKNNRKLLAALTLGVVLAGCQSQPSEEAVDTAAAEVIESGSHDVAGMTDSAVKSEEALAAEAAQALLSLTVFYFDFDQANVMSNSYDALQAHAAFLNSNPAAAIRLEGHADERGTREYNIALGERRAKAVEKFLLVNGVSASQIETISYGEENPAEGGHGEGSWAKNRRVEIVYK